jgi:hypothetical protein
MVGALANVNLAQLLEEWVAQGQNLTVTDAEGQPLTTFAVDELNVRDIQLDLNLVVPWQSQAIARTITVPNVALTDVTNLNVAEQLADSLGVALTEELSLLFFEEILPGALPYIQESMPASGLVIPADLLPRS